MVLHGKLHTASRRADLVALRVRRARRVRPAEFRYAFQLRMIHWLCNSTVREQIATLLKRCVSLLKHCFGVWVLPKRYQGSLAALLPLRSHLLRSALPCLASPRHALPCLFMPRRATPCHAIAMIIDAARSFAVLRYAMPLQTKYASWYYAQVHVRRPNATRRRAAVPQRHRLAAHAAAVHARDSCANRPQ